MFPSKIVNLALHKIGLSHQTFTMYLNLPSQENRNHLFLGNWRKISLIKREVAAIGKPLWLFYSGRNAINAVMLPWFRPDVCEHNHVRVL